MRTETRPVPSEQARTFLDTVLARPPAYERDIHDLREDTREVALETDGAREPVASVEDVDAAGVAARLYRPRGRESEVVVWVHGGGWVMGDVESYDAVARGLATRAACAVLSVDYRLAPEHRFPAALDDAWAATVWASRRFDTIAIAGDSAGGNLAAAVALRAREHGIELALQGLIYPVLDGTPDSALHREFERRYEQFGGYAGYGERCLKEIRHFWDLYVPDAALRANPETSPASARSLRGLAPAMVVTAEHDILRAEASAYADRMRRDGASVEVLEYTGQVHGFFHRLGEMADAEDALDRVGGAVRRAFDDGKAQLDSSSIERR